MNTLILLSLIAGVLAIDDRAGWQSLLAQPVFAALLVGFVTGEVRTAVAVGLILELIWLSILPMRGLRRPDQIAGAVVGAGTAALLMKLTADPRVYFISATGILVGLFAGELGARVSAPLFALLNRRLGRVEFSPEAGFARTARKLLVLQAGSTLYLFVVEAVVVFILLGAGYHGAERLTRYVGGALVAGAASWDRLLPALGAASLIHVYWHRHLKRVIILCAVMVILVLWLR
ncbi:MAG: PTS sugar transporter subunit IIC [Candidatus Krumholzibacteriia bacterium]